MPIEVVITVQEAAKPWIETWGNPLISAGAALVGAIVGGLFALHAARRQVDRQQEEADKAALFAINAKLISMADDADRLHQHMMWALGQDRASAVSMLVKPDAIRFALDELYRAHRFDKSNFVDSLRMVERGHLKSINDYSNAVDFSRVAEGPARLMTETPKPPRKMPEYLRAAVKNSAASARLAAGAAKNVMTTLHDVYLERYTSVLPTTAQATTNIVPTA